MMSWDEHQWGERAAEAREGGGRILPPILLVCRPSREWMGRPNLRRR